MTTATIVEAAPTDLGRGSLVQRVRRCLSVSVVTTVISVSTLLTATAFFGIEAWIANIIATSVATVPSYHLNRRWTWGRTEASDPLREVLPFWVMAFCGLALSTVTVGIADSWVAQFVVLDRVLFAAPAPPDRHADESAAAGT